ncbi:hypothetical protein [Amycolatopsis sp. NBC_01480]|uniref:hypothetical protein n=1 Tax=Amycolatopsis sp. NBC_01480 TaxID=2903562 RepID=UPI002E2E7B95|nr:hypothetical protein [Amycolatopsis sp. NBC_01480]
MADSRFRLQPHNSTMFPAREIYVGWDNVLHTYYAHVIDGNDDDGEERRTVDLGGDIAEITQPSSVIGAVRPYAEIPDDLGELLTISRVANTAMGTDLRTETQMDEGRRRTEQTRGALYTPFGFITTLTQDDVDPVLAEYGWTASHVHIAERGHIETYRRADQELVLPWGSPGEPYPEHLLSPIRIDGRPHSVSSQLDLDRALTESGPDSHGLTSDRDERIEGLDDELSSDHEETLTAGQGAGNESDSWWTEDPPADENGIHLGLGT